MMLTVVLRYEMVLFSCYHAADCVSSLSPSLCSHGCIRNLIDFFEIRCCGLIRPVAVDWTTQYTIEYDQSSGSGYQLV